MKKRFDELGDEVRDLISKFSKSSPAVDQHAILENLDDLGVTHHAEPGDTAPNEKDVANHLYVDVGSVMYAGVYHGKNVGEHLFHGDVIYFVIR